MWTVLVWIFSAICYFPLYFSHQGMDVPVVALNLKYFFVLMPLLITIIYLLRNGGIKKWIKEMFELRFQAEAFVFCLIVAVVGAFFSNMLAVQEWEPQTILAGAAYLFCMAFIEEVVWRGYRLKAIMQDKKEGTAIVLVSIEWAIWHIPMWAIRNFIGIGEITFWILYTAIVGYLLGKSFIRYRNILAPVLLHTIFNVCFLTPISINLILVSSLWIASVLFERAKEKRVN